MDVGKTSHYKVKHTRLSEDTVWTETDDTSDGNWGMSCTSVVNLCLLTPTKIRPELPYDPPLNAAHETHEGSANE